jgi:pimeloyl-ACP methyl ester carboxylesterase
VCFVPGVGGDGAGYSGLKDSLLNTGVSDLRVFNWGAPGPLFVMNFQSESIHNSAETDLAARLSEWLRQNPRSRIDLVGHSAGCGVILGALKRLDNAAAVDRVILLSPSVSPGYALEPALRHVRGALDSFYSDRDITFLKWRTSTFGSYDNVKTPAAGHLGFRPASPLPPDLAARLRQHAYDPHWDSLGNDGGHLGSVARDFVLNVVAPLLNGPANASAPVAGT